MLKIGIIGLGDIAKKAYLPLLSKKAIEVHLCSRDAATMANIGSQYRFPARHATVESLVDSGIDAAFVHTTTASHGEIVEKLLKHNIHVYIDKPLTYDYESSEKLVALAREKKLLLQIGFNRRYAPAYLRLKALTPNMIVMQKNRSALPGDVRTFIFDDFVHVVDTLSFLSPAPLNLISVTGKKDSNRLYHVVAQFASGNGFTAIGIMNRDSGTIHERVEVFTANETQMVTGLTETVIYSEKKETKLASNDWESTLYKRGFEQMVDEFLQAAASGARPVDYGQLLATHKWCEEIVARLNAI